MNSFLKNNTLVSMIIGMLFGIASTLKLIDSDNVGADDYAGQTCQSFAEILQALQKDQSAHLVTALKASVTVAQSWISFLESKPAEQTSSGLGNQQ